MESTTTSRYSPTIHIDNMSPQFLNPEDLHSAGSPTPAFDSDGQHSSATPKPVSVYSKPAKKRKSWGQSLPEPTTALPPRKRAKTDDEKEQRRIERIKRNRAAAHNSRERKRQETEGLAVSLARVQAELNAYRSLHGPLPAHIVLPEVNLVNTEPADTPAPSDSHGTYDDPSPESPEEDDLDFSLDTIKEEPTDNTTTPYLPSPFTNLDAKPLLDPMHPAVSDEEAPSFNTLDFSQLHNYLNQQQPSQHLLGNPLPPPHDTPVPDYLPDSTYSTLESFAFADGAYDATLSFNPQLDFSFDDLIDGTATVAVDGLGAA